MLLHRGLAFPRRPLPVTFLLLPLWIEFVAPPAPGKFKSLLWVRLTHSPTGFVLFCLGCQLLQVSYLFLEALVVFVLTFSS